LAGEISAQSATGEGGAAGVTLTLGISRLDASRKRERWIAL